MLILLYVNPNTSHNQILILTIKKKLRKKLSFEKYNRHCRESNPKLQRSSATLTTKPQHKNEIYCLKMEFILVIQRI